MRTVFLTFFLLVTLTGFSQKRKKAELKIPPGTARINDTLYFDKTEVTNIAWREWLAYLEQVQKDSIAFRFALPDTSVWRTIGTACNSQTDQRYTKPENCIGLLCVAVILK